MQRKQSEPYISTYLYNKGRLLGIPIGGNFELTARCNFNCPMCYVHLKQEDIDAQGRELTAQQWISIAKSAREQGMMFALLTGGEPFVRKDFFEIYTALKSMGLLISINSNGSMLSGDIRRKLIEDPPFRINISVYGGSNETYCGMCGLPAFDQVIENIRALKEAGIEVCINLSVTPHNRKDIKKIYEVAESLGVHVRATSYMYPSVRVNGEYGSCERLTPEEAADATVEIDTIRFTKEEFIARAENIHKLVAVEPKECSVDMESGVRCRAGNSSFWVTWDGRMVPCGMMPRPEAYPLRDGFEAAWETIRRETNEIRCPSQCTVCPKKEICSACAAVYITETGSFDKVPAYVCRQTDATIEKMWRAYLEQKGEEHAD